MKCLSKRHIAMDKWAARKQNICSHRQLHYRSFLLQTAGDSEYRNWVQLSMCILIDMKSFTPFNWLNAQKEMLLLVQYHVSTWKPYHIKHYQGPEYKSKVRLGAKFKTAMKVAGQNKDIYVCIDLSSTLLTAWFKVFVWRIHICIQPYKIHFIWV